MKRVIAVAAMLAAGSLLADGDNSSNSGDGGENLYGLMTVNTSDQRTIVAIPWIQASLTNGEITVADVVRTANLCAGDRIHYYNGTNFESWQLNDNKEWEKATSVVGDEIKATTAAEERVLKRGNALVLLRPTSGQRADCFYLWGQVASSTPTTKITAGAMNLIAPPSTNGLATINTVATWSNVNNNDRIYIQTSSNTIECKYDGGKWKYYAQTGSYKEVGGIKIPEWDWTEVKDPLTLGTGFWYKADAESSVSLVWNYVPVTSAE